MRSIPPQKELQKILFDEEACTTYLVEIGAVYDEINCEACGTLMKLNFNRKTFRCTRKTCRKELTMWKGSFFYAHRMPCCDVMNMAYLWLAGATFKTLLHIGKHSSKTVTAFISYFRQLVTSSLDDADTIIGGPGITVEIDESKIAKRKYNRGHMVTGSWVVGGIEREGGKRIFVKSVANRNAESLKQIILEHVRPGTTIITDYWRGYDWIDQNENYIHQKVNHSRNFKDPETGAHTNTIEGTWAGIKSNIPKRNRTEGEINSHIFYYIWRKQNKNDLWGAFISALREVHYDN